MIRTQEQIQKISRDIFLVYYSVSGLSNTNMSNGSILQFPTEIFHLIFDYLDFQTILQSIGLVCQSFEEIVNSYNRLKLDFSRVSSECQWKSIGEILRAENVRSITLNATEGSPFCRMNFFFSFFNFDQLIHLKSLRLIGINAEEFDRFIEQILRYRLKSLSIVFSQMTNEIEREINLISSMIVPCGLERVSLDLSDNHMIDVSALQSIKLVLHSLSIDYCPYEQYDQILSSCRSLKTFRAKSFRVETTDMSPVVSSNLTSLIIESHSLSMEGFSWIFLATPFLQHLRIVLRYCQRWQISPGQFLEKLIPSRLVHLKTLQFSLTCYPSSETTICSLSSIIESFQTPYWLNEKQCLVHCDYPFRSSEIIIYTPPLKLNTDEDLIRLTNYSSSDQYNLIIRNQSNFDEQVRRVFSFR